MNEDRNDIVDGKRGKSVNKVELVGEPTNNDHAEKRADTSESVADKHLVEQVEVVNASRTVSETTHCKQ